MSKFAPVGQDWAEVNISKRPPSAAAGGPRAGVPAPGETKFVSRQSAHASAGGRTINQQHRSGPVANHKKLDDDHETLKHKTIDHQFRVVLQQARTKKGWSQKDLALQCQERETTIKEYENGKAIPNNQIISKMERALGIHLRGKDAGQEIQKPQSKKEPAKPASK